MLKHKEKKIYQDDLQYSCRSEDENCHLCDRIISSGVEHKKVVDGCSRDINGYLFIGELHICNNCTLNIPEWLEGDDDYAN